MSDVPNSGNQNTEAALSDLPRFSGAVCTTCHRPWKKEEDRVWLYRYGHGIYCTPECLDDPIPNAPRIEVNGNMVTIHKPTAWGKDD